MYKQVLEKDLKQAVKDLGLGLTDILVSISENPHFGDYSTNIALQLAKQDGEKTKQSPREIANLIIEKFGHPAYLERVEVAGPGFINFYIKDQSLLKVLDNDPKEKNNKPLNILLEYADPNTHKEFHIGHLRTLIYGESLARMFEFTGNNVYRVNYGSDIGPTVAKALWGIQQLKDEYEVAKEKSLREKVAFLGKAYAYAHTNYEDNETAKAEIDEINKRIYQRDEDLLPLWEETKDWSLGYFETIFSRFNTVFDRRVNESEIDQVGQQVVQENVGKVFIEDQGAIIFPGEKYGLHNRVFITSKGYPTYEGKEVGLIEKYQEVFPFDEAIILSDLRQASFFEVVNKAIELLHPHLLGKKKYFGYGKLDLTTGAMSSRKGNIISSEDLIDQIKEVISQNSKLSDSLMEKLAIAAIKFYYLKYSINSDMIYDVEKSVALQGDTGVYVMYTYVRTVSVLGKVESASSEGRVQSSELQLEEEEREVLRQLEYFDIVVSRAAKEYAPSYICLYLLDLSRAFNLFYEKYPILTSSKSDFRLRLTKKVGETLKLGLHLLGIEAVERM